MSRADYAHWNEEADQVWWAEEGRHEPEMEDRYAAEAEWRDEPIPEDDEDDECQGHEPGPYDPPGITVYCDGSCRKVSHRRAS